MGDNSNIAAQIEEVEALAAIYGEDWIVESEANRKYTISIEKDIRLHVRLPDDYPSHAPPYFELDAVPLSGADRELISDRLNSLYGDNVGDAIVYIWVEAVRDYISSSDAEEQQSTVDSVAEEQEAADVPHMMLHEPDVQDICPDIFHDEPITDRKSTFQAHVAAVTDIQQVSQVMRELLSNKKIAGASHNIQAYRIQLSNGSIAEDCDDDGETHAGSRLLHLLNIVGSINVLVVVTRWYGGIQLGPDRFKHINNSARNALEKQNFISTSQSKGSSKKSHRKS